MYVGLEPRTPNPNSYLNLGSELRTLDSGLWTLDIWTLSPNHPSAIISVLPVGI